MARGGRLKGEGGTNKDDANANQRGCNGQRDQGRPNDLCRAVPLSRPLLCYGGRHGRQKDEACSQQQQRQTAQLSSQKTAGRSESTPHDTLVDAYVETADGLCGNANSITMKVCKS